MKLSAKTLLRREARERIEALSAIERLAFDRAVCRNLLQLARLLGSEIVLGYLALGDEVRVDAFLAAVLQDGLRVLLPRCHNGFLVFRNWTPLVRLERDGEGVLTPNGADHVDFGGARALVVVPGRAFDGDGGRVGRGGGYYDRMLMAPAAARASVVGVSYHCQVFAAVPMENHDARVGGIVTENGYRSASGA